MRRTVKVAVSESANSASVDVDDRLAERERLLRLVGELVLFLGAMALLAGLFFTRQISGFDYLKEGFIHLPDALVGGYDYAKPVIEERVLPEFRNVPGGNPFFTVVLLFAVFSSLLRGRQVITWVFFGFCIVPWPLLGLMIPGVGVVASLILIYKVLAALRRKDLGRAAILGIGIAALWTYFSLDQMDPMRGENRRPVIRYLGLANDAKGPANKSKETRRLTTFADMTVTTEAQKGAKAYVLAQEGFLRNDAHVVRENLTPAVAEFGAAGSLENNRLAALRNYLASEGVGEPAEISAYQSRARFYRIVTNVFFVFAAIGILSGSLLEMLAARVVRRTMRIEKIREKLQPLDAGQAIADGGAASVSLEVASIRKLKLRAIWMAAVAVPLAIAAVAAGAMALSLSVPPATGSNGFSSIHILQPALANFPHGYLNVSVNASDFLDMPSPLIALLPYAGFVGLVTLLALRKYRYFLILLICAVAYSSYGLFGLNRNGLVELSITDIKPSTIAAMRHHLTVSLPVNGAAPIDEYEGRSREAYRYILAQIAYVSGNRGDTTVQLQALGVPKYWGASSVQWRLAIMQEWLATSGVALTSETRPFINPETFRALSGSLLLIALGLVALGAPFAGLATLLMVRKRRLEAFIVEIGRQNLGRKAALIG